MPPQGFKFSNLSLNLRNYFLLLPMSYHCSKQTIVYCKYLTIFNKNIFTLYYHPVVKPVDININWRVITKHNVLSVKLMPHKSASVLVLNDDA